MTEYMILGHSVGNKSKSTLTTNPRAMIQWMKLEYSRIQVWVRGDPDNVVFDSIQLAFQDKHTVYIDKLPN